MIVETTRFGALEIPDEQVLDLPRGILGFPRQHRYAVLAREGQGPFLWLQSVDRPELAFVLLDPAQFIDDYRPVVTAEELRLLGTTESSELQCYAVVTVGDDPVAMTANLLAPIVMHERTRKALQAVQTSGDWPIQYRVIDGMRELAGGRATRRSVAE